MPLVRLSITQELTAEKRKALLDGIGEAISEIPGKEGRTLIVDLEEGKTMYLGGVKQENLVFADVKYFSNFSYQKKQNFTVAAFNAINSVLGTSKDRMFLTITELNSWGGFGDFKDEFYSDPD